MEKKAVFTEHEPADIELVEILKARPAS